LIWSSKISQIPSTVVAIFGRLEEKCWLSVGLKAEGEVLFFIAIYLLLNLQFSLSTFCRGFLPTHHSFYVCCLRLLFAEIYHDAW